MRETATLSEILFDVAIWILLVISMKSALRYPYNIPKSNLKISYCLLLLFCLFPYFGGDYFHYLSDYESIKQGGYSHIEDVYIWIIQNFSYSYLFFRLLVWGAALYMTIYSYKRLDPHSNLALFFFGAFYILSFSYARVSLAMSMIFLGLSLIAKPKKGKKLLYYALGGGLLLCSIYFHRSAIIGVVAAVISLIFNSPQKRTVIITVLLFPLAITILRSLLSHIMSDTVEFESYTLERQLDTYLNGEEGTILGLGAYISNLFIRGPLYLIAISYIICSIRGYFSSISLHIRIIASYAFFTILIAIAFRFNLGFNTDTFYYRTLMFAMIPSALFLAQLYKSNYLPKIFKWISYTSLFGVAYSLIYSAYCSIVNGI